MENLYSTLILIISALNFIATFFVLKHLEFSSFKKFVMLLLIWCIPLIGFCWVWLMLRDKSYANGNNNDITASAWFGASSGDFGGDGGASDGGGD